MPKIEVFIAYASQDELLCKELEKHLVPLHQEGLITSWHYRRIPPKAKWKHEVDRRLRRASIILLLVSADFLASDYCYGAEIQQALQQHRENASRVIPIVLQPVGWRGAPFGQLQALPSNDKAITVSDNQDQAFANVADGVRQVIQDLPVKRDNVFMSLLKLLVMSRLGWAFIGLLVLVSGTLWGLSSPTTPYIDSSKLADKYFYTPTNTNDIYFYPTDKSSFFLVHQDSLSPHLIPATIPQDVKIRFVARSDTISVNDVNSLGVKEAHVIEKLTLYDTNGTLIGTYTASDFNPSGTYENRWFPVGIALIVVGPLIAGVALFVGRKRRKDA